MNRVWLFVTKRRRLLLFHVVLSEELVKLFQEDEGENGVRSETEEVRRESLPESKESLLTDELLDAIHAATVFATPTHKRGESHSLHHLETSLDDIDGQRDDGAEETGSEGRGDVETQTVLLEEMPPILVEFLGLRVTSELSGVEDHGTNDRSGGSLPQRLDSLLLADAVDSLNTVGVSTTLFGRKTVIGRSTDQRNLSRVSNDSSTGSSDHSTKHLLHEVDLAVVLLLHVVQTARVHSHTRGGVGDLAEDSGSVTTLTTPTQIHPLYSLKNPSFLVIFLMASQLLVYSFFSVPSPLHNEMDSTHYTSAAYAS